MSYTCQRAGKSGGLVALHMPAHEGFDGVGQNACVVINHKQTFRRPNFCKLVARPISPSKQDRANGLMERLACCSREPSDPLAF